MRIIFIFLSLLNFTALGQQQNLTQDYERLKCEGKVPVDFQNSASSEFNKVMDELSRRERKKLDEFYIKSRYGIDALLRSGIVLFNDEVTTYVNSVANEVLKMEPELNKQLRFYTIKSNASNAFSTDQGIIFITTGLISRLGSEDELAFILAHEIAHYTERHVVGDYIYSQDILSDKKKNHITEILESLSKYSQQNELEADSLGMLRLMKTKYNVHASIDAMEVLKTLDQPIDTSQNFANILAKHNLFIPESFISKKQVTRKTTSGELSSHPSENKRIACLKSIMNKQNIDADNKGRLSTSEFKYIRDLCRFEAIRLCLIERNYIRALHDISCLNEKYPANNFLQLALSKALYFGSIDRLDLEKYPSDSFKEHYPYSYSVMRNLKEEMLYVICVSIMYDTYFKLDGINEIYLNDLLGRLKSQHKLGPFNFIRHFEKPEKLGSDFTVEHKIALNADTNFVRLWASSEVKFSTPQEFTDLKRSTMGERLGIEKVIIFSPTFESYKIRRKTKVEGKSDIVRAEKNSRKLVESFENVSRRLEMNNKMINLSEVNSLKAEDFNQFSLITEALIEQILSIDIERELSSQQYEIEAFGKNESTYLLLSHVSIVNYPESWQTALLLGLFPHGSVIGLYKLLEPNSLTTINYLLLDLKTGELIATDQRELIGRNLTKGIALGHSYDFLNQIKTEKR